MACTRILLDSNAYFRLARSIHPLLDREFGESSRYCLYVIADLEKEFSRSARLQRKFRWVDTPEYRENRRRKLQISKTERKKIKQVFDYMLNHSRSEGLGTSRVDVMALATVYVLQIALVTDDQDMLALAETFQIPTLKTLALMRLMLDAGHIDKECVRQICEYWQFQKDLPANFREEYLYHFEEKPPRPI
ncbi:MAG: DNA-binding protein [Candidatus Hydrogenedentota bacterium]